MTTRTSLGTSAAALTLVAAVASGGACTAGQPHVSSDFGTARADIEVAPADVLCLDVAVTQGSVVVSRHFDITPLSATTFLLESLPLGVDSFTAAAYGVACPDSGTPSAPPAWIGGPITATVAASPPVEVTIPMVSTSDSGADGGGAIVGIQFPAPSAACPPVIKEFATPTATSNPGSIATGPDDNIWFTEGNSGADKVGEMSPTGGPITEIGPFAGGAFSIVAGPDGNLWFGDGTSSLARMTTTGGLGSVVTYAVAGQVSATAPGPGSTVWFAFGQRGASGNGVDNIGSIDTSQGASSIQYYSAPNTNDGTADIDGLVSGPDGRMWFTDFGSDTIGAVAPASGVISEYPTTTAGSQPSSIAVGPDGNIWFTEYNAGKIGLQVVTSRGVGAMTEYTIPTANSGPSSIVAGPDGNVWFTEEKTGKIGVISPTGGAASIQEFAIPTPDSAPAAITVGPDGNLWFAEAGSANIGYITPYGVCPGTAPVADASLPDSTTGGGDSGAVGARDSGPDASSGLEASTGCEPACAAGSVCVDGVCEGCGNATQYCCAGGTCNADLTCAQGTCSCGGPDEACCGGTTCNQGITCQVDAGAICACGGPTQACCPTTSGGSACGTGLHCSGLDCSCLAACAGYIVQKSDGSIWNTYSNSSGVAQEITVGVEGAPLYASAFASAYVYLACAVANNPSLAGTVYCWDLASGTDTDGQLGNGTFSTSATATTSQVLTGPGNPLTGITSVSIDDGSGQTACAVSSSGTVWCWGNGGDGQLGNGVEANSAYAVPVLVEAAPLGADAGTPFANVKKVAVGPDHVCALDNAGQVWCWGSNNYGQCGALAPDGGVGQTTVSYPTLVANIGSLGPIVDVAVNSYETCVVAASGEPYCWGYRAYGILGNGSSTSGDQYTPALDAGVSSILNAVQITMPSVEAACVLRSDRSIWCWGSSYGGSTPEQLTVSSPSSHVVANVDFMGSTANTTAPCFVDDQGNFYANTSTPVSPAGSVDAGPGLTCP